MSDVTIEISLKVVKHLNLFSFFPPSLLVCVQQLLG